MCTRRGDGRPKQRHESYALARATAARLAQEQNLQYEAYRCSRCLSWHVGKAKRSGRWDAEWELELGVRVGAHLAGENGRTMRKPSKWIRDRFGAAVRRRARAASTSAA